MEKEPDLVYEYLENRRIKGFHNKTIKELSQEFFKDPYTLKFILCPTLFTGGVPYDVANTIIKCVEDKEIQKCKVMFQITEFLLKVYEMENDPDFKLEIKLSRKHQTFKLLLTFLEYTEAI